MADIIAPTLVQTSPSDNATGVSVTSNLRLGFSEAVNATSGLIKIYKSDGTLVYTIAANDTSQVSLDSTKTKVTIDPSVSLLAGTSYYVIIETGAFEDLAGNDYAGISSTAGFNFTTAGTSGGPPIDTTAPVLTGTNPVHDATNFDVGGNLVLTFSEGVKRGSGDIELYNRSDGTTLTIDVNDTSQVTISGNQLVLNPTNNLAPHTSYYIILDPGVVTDFVNNGYAGLPSGTITFTTNDPLAPVLIASSPTDGETNTPQISGIVLVFDEPVRAGMGNVQIYESDGTLFWSIDINDQTRVHFSSEVINITLAYGYAENTSYYIIIPAGTIEDFAGNDYAGILSPAGLNFATPDVTPPILLSTSSLTDVSTNGTIVLTFDELVMASTGEIVIVTMQDGQAFAIIDADDTTQVSFVGNTVTIDPSADFDPATEYYLGLTYGPIRDLSGYAYSGFLYFTTAAANAGVVLTGTSTANTLVGGAGNDVITGLGRNDTLTGAGGADTFVYTAVSDSTSRGYDTITDFTASADLIDLWFQVTGVDTAITSGSLSPFTMDSNLASAVGAAKLGAHHAVLFTPNAGMLSGKTFLIVDANGVAGYQANADLVILLGNGSSLAGLTAADFV